jgi:sugar/nucleoside kinase (ribokinase family)
MSNESITNPTEVPMTQANAPLEAVSVGIIVADCVARPVLSTPPKGKLVLVDNIGLYSGGSAASTGYGLARFGVRTAVVGRVGRDGFGDFLVAEAARHGADSSLIVRDKTVATSATLVTVDGEGERTFIHAIGANARLAPSDVPLEHLRSRGARVLHVAGMFALPGMEGTDGSPTRDLFAHASGLGFVTSLDSVWDATGRWAQVIGPMLAHTDIFCPSIHEAAAITGLETNAAPRAIAERLFDMGVRQIVALKMGPEGSFVMSSNRKTHRLGILSVPSVDGTGAGDAFIAGLLTGFLQGASLLECARLGTAAGAMCVRALGAMPGITDRNDLERMAKDVPILNV